LMKYARCYHSAVRLKNGTVLVTGGIGQEVSTKLFCARSY
jgi:hypothetical protein